MYIHCTNVQCKVPHIWQVKLTLLLTNNTNTIVAVNKPGCRNIYMVFGLNVRLNCCSAFIYSYYVQLTEQIKNQSVGSQSVVTYMILFKITFSHHQSCLITY